MLFLPGNRFFAGPVFSPHCSSFTQKDASELIFARLILKHVGMYRGKQIGSIHPHHSLVLMAIRCKQTSEIVNPVCLRAYTVILGYHSDNDSNIFDSVRPR